MTADGVGELDTLPHEHQTDPMKPHDALLLRALDLDEAHRRSGHRLADRLGVRRVVLLPLDVRLHIGRWHQANVVTELAKLSSPIVR